MTIKFGQVDMELELMGAATERAPDPAATEDLGRLLRSSAFREALRPIVIEIVGEELERARRRFG